MTHPLVSSPQYQRTIADYEPLLEREIPSELESSRIDYTSTPLTLHESELSPEMLDTLAKRGFTPLARVGAQGPIINVDVEWWVDDHGTIIFEYGLAPESMVGKYYLSTYYSDGTAVSVQPSDSLNTESDGARVRLRGVDDLDQDITTAVEDRAKRVSADRRALLTVDLRTAELRHEFYARHFPTDMRILLHVDALVSRNDRVRRRSKQGYAVIAVLLVINFVAGWPTILAVGTAVITGGYMLFQVWRFLTPGKEVEALTQMAQAEADRLNIPSPDGSDHES